MLKIGFQLVGKNPRLQIFSGFFIELFEFVFERGEEECVGDPKSIFCIPPGEE